MAMYMVHLHLQIITQFSASPNIEICFLHLSGFFFLRPLLLRFCFTRLITLFVDEKPYKVTRKLLEKFVLLKKRFHHSILLFSHCLTKIIFVPVAVLIVLYFRFIL